MRGGPHALLGAAAGIAGASLAAKNISFELFLPAAGIGAICALLPDLDHPKSTASRAGAEVAHMAEFGLGCCVALYVWMYQPGWLLGPLVLLSQRNAIPSEVPIIAVMLGVLTFGAMYVFGTRFAPWRLFEHRGPLHTLLATLVFGATLHFLLIADLWVMAATFGYLSHLLSDAMTWSGVALFWPLNRTPIHVLPRRFRFASGGRQEWPIVVTLVAFIVWLSVHL